MEELSRERGRWGGHPGWMLTLAEAGAGPGGSAEAAGGRTVAHHVLLRLEKDDVQLGREQAAEHHGATEADGHTHGSGLHLHRGPGVSQAQGPGPRTPARDVGQQWETGGNWHQAGEPHRSSRNGGLGPASVPVGCLPRETKVTAVGEHAGARVAVHACGCARACQCGAPT